MISISCTETENVSYKRNALTEWLEISFDYDDIQNANLPVIAPTPGQARKVYNTC